MYKLKELNIWDGEGTEANPYLLKNEDDLKTFSIKVNQGKDYEGYFFKLYSSIMLSTPWIPIGKDNHRFNGCFDGSNHAISNLTVNDPNYKGLFGVTDENAIVKNLNITNSLIECETTECFVGTVVAENYGTICNCSTENIHFKIKAPNIVRGALTGSNKGLIKECTTVSYIEDSYGYIDVGGIAGENISAAKIKDCKVVNEITICNK